jgi:hypothetical protein
LFTHFFQVYYTNYIYDKYIKSIRKQKMSYKVGNTTVIDESRRGFFNDVFRSETSLSEQLRVGGGIPVNIGGNLLLNGPEFVGNPNLIELRQGTSSRITVDTNGGISLTAGGTNQNITLTPSGTGTVNSPTFNATSTTLGGFQGIGGDSATNPSFTWSGNLNTGMYRSGTNQISFTTNGVQRLVVGTVGSITSGMSPTSGNNAYGFRVQSSFTGADNTYAFRSDLPPGTDRYCFFDAGGANSFFGSGNCRFLRDENTPSTNNRADGITIRASSQINGSADGSSIMDVNRRGTNGNLMVFRKDGSQCGTISVATNSTTYNTSSDVRLKENIVDSPSASEDIESIKVRSFNWKANNEYQKYGFIAQELLEVAPYTVSELEDSGMLSVDYSKFVPMMIREIQSLRQRISELEND